jgi:hypothetical protein
MRLISIFTIALFTFSCSSNQSSQSKINTLEVSEKLIKGQTTQAQVIENFGAPDIVEKTPEGDMWAYNRHANESKSMGAGVTHYIAAAGLWNWTGLSMHGDQSSSSTNTASLVLYFGTNKKLRTYSYRTEKY